MNYDKTSFLCGLAVGRQLKGWGQPGGAAARGGVNVLDNPTFAGAAAGQSWQYVPNDGAPDSTPCMAGWYIKNGRATATGSGVRVERVEGSDLAYSAAFFMQKLPVRDLTRFFARRCAVGAVVDGVRYRFTDVLRPFQQQFGALMGPYVGPGFRIRVYGYAWSDYLMWTFDATNAVGAAGPVISHAYFSLDGEA